MLRRQSVIALGVAILLGVVAVYLANVFLDARVRAAQESPEGMTKVAVAAVPLDFGKTLTPEQVKFVDYATPSLPPGVFKSMAELTPDGKARVVLRPIQVNQPILLSDVSGEGHPSIASLLPDGMRAVTVTVNAVSGVAGFVVPNDTVDVLITRDPINQNNGPTPAVTDVLLQDVKVIATDQRQSNPDGQPIVSQTATLQVTPVDAQKLVLGQRLGSLSFVLRKPGEQQNIPAVETVSLADLRYSYGSGVVNGSMVGAAARAGQSAAPPKVEVRRLAPRPRPAAPAPAAPRPAPPATRDVEVTRGTVSSTYEVGDYAR